MLKWSRSYFLPQLPRPTCLRNAKACYVLDVEKNVWVIEQTSSEYMNGQVQLGLYIFDTATYEVTPIEIPRPKFTMNAPIHCAASSGDDVYVWWHNNKKSYTLMKLPAKTLKWEKILEWEEGKVFTECVIDGDIMKILGTEDAYEGKVLLYTISLSKKIVVKKIVLKGDVKHSMKLFSHDNQLYASVTNGTLIGINRIEDGYVELLNIHDTDPNNQHLMLMSDIFQSHQFIGKGLALDQLLTFDFTKQEWTKRSVYNAYRLMMHNPAPSVEIDGVIYALVETRVDMLSMNLSLHVLEVPPTLATMCLQRILDGIPENDELGEVEALKAKIPSLLKAKLDNMVQRRSDQHGEAIERNDEYVRKLLVRVSRVRRN